MKMGKNALNNSCFTIVSYRLQCLASSFSFNFISDFVQCCHKYKAMLQTHRVQQSVYFERGPRR